MLFLDELNACSQEVQKAFYSLIYEKRIGEYYLPEGSIVIGAGNRAQDSMKGLSAINYEIAQMVVSSDEGEVLPDWFMVEIVRDLPRLVHTDDKRAV